GYSIKYSPDNTIKSIEHLKNGQNVNWNRKYSKDGSIQNSYYIDNFRRDSTYIEYYKNGMIKNISFFKEGELEYLMEYDSCGYFENIVRGYYLLSNEKYFVGNSYDVEIQIIGPILNQDSTAMGYIPIDEMDKDSGVYAHAKKIDFNKWIVSYEPREISDSLMSIIFYADSHLSTRFIKFDLYENELMLQPGSASKKLAERQSESESEPA
ncbi:MAG: hypothetical protein PF448_12455, partial [Bacteroidales bacterium]|nr:hypothetical protein [Bacteroidales bacterium]